MKTEKQLEDIIKSAEKVLEEAKSQLKEFESKSKYTRFRANGGEIYHFVNCDGDSDLTFESNYEDYYREDDYRYNSLNYYKTEELCDKWAVVMQFRAEFSGWYWTEIGDWRLNLNLIEDKFCFWYVHRYKNFEVGYVCSGQSFEYYFPERKSAQKAIDKFGDKLHMLSPMYRVDEEVSK